MPLAAFLAPIAPFVGAVALEVFYWFQLSHKLLPVKSKRVLRSPFYWITTALAVVFGGICALLLFPSAAPGALLLAGAAMPILLKKLVAGFVRNNGPKLGPNNEPEPTPVRDYLSVA